MSEEITVIRQTANTYAISIEQGAYIIVSEDEILIRQPKRPVRVEFEDN